MRWWTHGETPLNTDRDRSRLGSQPRSPDLGQSNVGRCANGDVVEPTVEEDQGDRTLVGRRGPDAC